MTSGMGRKTYCNFCLNLFLFSENTIRLRTHHDSIAEFQKYVKLLENDDMEKAALETRAFQLWGQGHYKPSPVDPRTEQHRLLQSVLRMQLYTTLLALKSGLYSFRFSGYEHG